MVTLTDLSLRDIHLRETLPRLWRIRDRHFRLKPEICLELPRNITQFMREWERDPAQRTDSAELRAGKLYQYVMKQKTAVIAAEDESLLAGTTTSKPLGVILYPDLAALFLWPELETVARRPKNPFKITVEEIKELNEEIFPYWLDKTILEVTRADNHNPRCQEIYERIVFFIATKPASISHTVPNYRVVLEQGLRAIIRDAQEKQRRLGNSGDRREEWDFYQAVQLSLSGIITYAEKLSRKAAEAANSAPNAQRRDELREMSRICAKVPAEAPDTLHEALNAIWICKVALHQENTNAALSPGRLDQILYPFYARDLQRGMTPAQAAELVGCFWLKMADHAPMSPQTAEQLFGGAGSNQAVTLGGIDMQGNDAVNDLTYIMLKVTELLKLRDPNVNARYHPDSNSRAYLDRLCEVNINTQATPCFHNDKAAIEALQGQGVSLEHARDYAVVGCVEPTSAGRTFGHTGCMLMNLTTALEMALNRGIHPLTQVQGDPHTPPAVQMNSFQEFKDALEAQLSWLIDQAVTMNNMLGRTHQKIHPTPMLSAMMEGCLDKGKDVLRGGATYNSSGAAMIGLAEMVDSVTAIEKFVFNERRFTMGQLLAAIEHNWEGPYQALQATVQSSSDRFGTDSAMAKANANWLMAFLHATFQSKPHYRDGAKYTVGYWSMTNHAGFGMLTGALPSGRQKSMPFASGITPVSGAAPSLNACLNFVAGLDHMKIANGQALNLKFPPATATVRRLADRVEAYCRSGGLQVQCNVMTREFLKEYLENARHHPDEYHDLLVRVSGYTAYFVDLNPLMQDEIITRTEHDLVTGQARPQE
jgi:pyruvate formate-lyase/glycerol dehydratase family glycyl radical enzyme